MIAREVGEIRSAEGLRQCLNLCAKGDETNRASWFSILLDEGREEGAGRIGALGRSVGSGERKK